MRLLLTILLFISFQANAQIVYDSAIYITAGGTYTGNWKADDGSPAVRINCYSPVTIINSNIKSSGIDILAYGGAKLTVKYTNIVGQTPVNNGQWGRAVDIYQPQTFVFEHNYVEHTGGIIVDHGNQNTDSVSIKYNLIRNTDKRRVDGSEGEHRASILFNTVDIPQGIKGEIAWNRFENILDSSWIEDNINLGNVIATQARPFLIHDNYIKGAYPPSTYGNSSYTGSGITVEGEGGHNLATTVSQWIRIYNNQVISVCNGGININAGHDIHSYHNTILSSGLFPNGVQSYYFWAARSIWNGSNVAYPSVFHDIDMIDDSVGYVRPGVNQPFTDRQDEVFVSGSPINVNSSASYHYPNPITLAKEVDQLRIFNLKVANNGLVIGNNTATPPTPPTPPFAFNKYYLSNSGNDASAGTSISTAWASWSRLMTALSSTVVTGDSVLFNRGNTWYGAITTIPANGVAFGAYGTGAKPIITGLTNLTTWTNVGTNLWESACNSGNNLDLVLVGGVTKPAGRSPNYGTYYNVDSYTTGATATVTSTSTNASSQSWVGAQIVVRVNEYNLPRLKINSHSGTTLSYTTIGNTDPTLDNPNQIDGSGHKFFIQKHPATLDAQNEWYYNPSTFTLRMYSTVNPSALSVRASTKDWFLNADYKSDLSFNNLQIIGYDSNAIMGRLFLRLKLVNNYFEDEGVDGIALDNDSSTYIGYNVFNRMGNTAIYSHYTTRSKVEFNNINNCGLIYGMSLANNQQRDGICIEVFNNSGRLGDSIYICDNIVQNVGYCGIRFTGTNAEIRRNYVNEFGLIDSDGGGIYTNADFGLANQRVIANNVVTNGHGKHDMTSSPGDHGMVGIYLDDDTGDIDIIDNTVKNTTRGNIFLHNTVHINVLRNKLFAGNGEFVFCTGDDGLGGPVRNIVLSDNDMYGLPGNPLIELSSNLNDFSSQGIFSNNRYARSSMTTPFSCFGPGGGNFSFAQWNNTFGYDGTSSLMQVNDDSVRIDLNSTAVDQYVLLSSTYSNFKGAGYYNYVKVPAFSSLLLYRKTFGSIKTTRPVKFSQ